MFTDNKLFVPSSLGAQRLGGLVSYGALTGFLLLVAINILLPGSLRRLLAFAYPSA